MEGSAADRSAAMEAFRMKSMARSSVPAQGVEPQGAAPQTPQGMAPQPPQGGAPQEGSETVNILKQVTGEVTEDEITEVLIKRLKNLMADKEKQGGPVNAIKQ